MSWKRCKVRHCRYHVDEKRSEDTCFRHSQNHAQTERITEVGNFNQGGN